MYVFMLCSLFTVNIINTCSLISMWQCYYFLYRTVARRTEGFQSGDLVTLVDKAISLCEIRTLYPQGILSLIPSSPVKPHLSARLHHVSHVSTDSSSSDLEASSKSFSTPPSSPCKKQTFKKPFESNPSLMHTKKMSLASTDSTHTLIQEEGSMFTITRPFEHSVSLSQMKLGVNDFKRALKGFVPVALRGLPLHKSGTIDFSSVGGLKSVKKCLKETLLWPSKVSVCCGFKLNELFVNYCIFV